MVKQISTLPVLPALVVGHVSHIRRQKMPRKFRHRTYQWLVDLDRLPSYRWYLRPLATFNARDHLGDPRKSIKENVLHFLTVNRVNKEEIAKVLMLANARVLGYTFDPLTVFWCLDRNDEVVCVLAEVRNTYGQRHLYLLQLDSNGRAQTAKQFHVSPFLEIKGHYEMHFLLTSDVVSTTVTLHQEEGVAFTANFSGRPVPAIPKEILRQFITNPFMTQRTSILIRIHGIWLWLRRLPVFQLPHHDLQEGA